MISRPGQISFRDRLLAKATAIHEHHSDDVADDAQAVTEAKQQGGNIEQRIVCRAALLPSARPLRDAIRSLNTVLAWIMTIAILLAFLAGAATARTTLGIDGPGVVNIYWVLGGVLGVQSMALALWVIFFVTSFRLSRVSRHTHHAPMSSVSLGSMVLGVAQWVARRVHQDALHTAAVHAVSRAYAAGRIGRWAFSSMTHALWLAFNIGCLLMVIALLSARQYTFVWETTILTEQHYITLTRVLGTVPEAVGFPVPDEQLISQSQRRHDRPSQAAGNEAWSSMLVGCIVVYGFGPRLLLLGFSLGRWRAGKRAYRLDTTSVHYATLQRRLADPPAMSEPSAEQPSIGQAHHAATAQSQRPPRPQTSPAIVGIEVNLDAAAWPPSMAGVPWQDLGFIDGREDQQLVLERLTNAPDEPACLVLVCDLASTPDRGMARLVHELTGAVSQPPALVLTGGQVLRSRGHDARRIEQRVALWRSLAEQSGIEPSRVVEADLAHLTSASANRIAKVVGHSEDASSSSTNQRHIEAAFACIAAHTQKWPSTRQPNAAEQAELHRALAKVYQHRSTGWRQAINAPDMNSVDSLTNNVSNTLRTSADRVVSMLPDRLRRSPRWLAAGAMSGALGCVAAATLLSPVAIAALPTWSIIGAALGAFLQPSSSSANDQDHTAHDHGDAVRAAALFAMLLELQGKDEAVISRILDQVLEVDEADQVMSTQQKVQQVLDQWRHRLDIALAEHAS